MGQALNKHGGMDAVSSQETVWSLEISQQHLMHQKCQLENQPKKETMLKLESDSSSLRKRHSDDDMAHFALYVKDFLILLG